MKNPSALAQEFIETGYLKSVRIIDMHTHMGGFYGSSMPNASADKMLDTMERLNIEFIVSAPHSALFDPTAGNSEIEKVMQQYPGRIYGYYSYNPNYREDICEIDTKIKSNDYIGFKLLPDYHKYPLDGKYYEDVFEYAENKCLPILTHTWGMAMYGDCYSSIDRIKNVVKRYKNIKLIMGHSIQGQCDDAIDIANNYKNTYLELTDTYRLNGVLEKMVAKCGSDRILFGTDLPWYDPAYCLGCILYAKIHDKDKINILYKNAKILTEK
jgi:uncharacterized protein